RQLYATIKHITTQNEILRNENHGLKSALIEEKRKRKRQKPLKSYLREEDDQAAVIFSPNKIAYCRQRIKDIEQEKEQEESRRLEDKIQKEIAQKEKALAAQEKKIQAERRRLQNQAIKETIKANQQLREENKRHNRLLKEAKKAERQKQAQKKGLSSRRKGQKNTP